MSDLISIVMPAYNTADYIKDSLESVLSQTYSDWELIIVDDCSTDNTAEIIRPFLSDGRIKYLRNEKNSGAAISRNRALREARGKWVAFLDSDDVWHKEKLEKQLSFMKENNYKFSFTDYNIQLEGQWLPYVYTAPKVINKRRMKNYCYFSTITVMYDREYVGLIQVEPIKVNNDYAMWLKVIEKTKAYRLAECLSSYIKHDGSVSSGSKLKLIKHHYILWHVAEKKSKFSATILTLRNLFFGVIKKIKYKKPIKQ